MLWHVQCNELFDWVLHHAQPGDVAYWQDKSTDKLYAYLYEGPDHNPYWRELDKEMLKAYIEKKEEESKMNKRCGNCEHFASISSGYTYCTHEEHKGRLVPDFTSCSEHEFKKETPGPFDNLKFFLKDKDTGELDVKYICEDCGKVMDKPFHWLIKLPMNNKSKSRLGYYFYCEECNKKRLDKETKDESDM